MAKIITISGKAEAGKDLTASLLERRFTAQGKRVLVIHYADYLKFICQKYFGWDGVKNDKGRTILQRVGTDIVRNRRPTFWVEVVSMFLEVFEPDYDYILIPDCRFPNEIDFMKESFATISVLVKRLNFENRLTPEQRKHPSEIALDDYDFDYIVESDSGEGNLYNALIDFVEQYNL